MNTEVDMINIIGDSLTKEVLAKELGEKTVLNRCFADGAYDALLIEGDKPKHDKTFMDTIDKAVPLRHSFRSGVSQFREPRSL